MTFIEKLAGYIVVLRNGRVGQHSVIVLAPLNIPEETLLATVVSISNIQLMKGTVSNETTATSTKNSVKLPSLSIQSR
jgi:hypothetical protein